MAKVLKIRRRYDGAIMGRLAFSPALANTRIMNKNAFYVPMIHLGMMTGEVAVSLSAVRGGMR